jgi:hypothetical protein
MDQPEYKRRLDQIIAGHQNPDGSIPGPKVHLMAGQLTGLLNSAIAGARGDGLDLARTILTPPSQTTRRRPWHRRTPDPRADTATPTTDQEK